MTTANVTTPNLNEAAVSRSPSSNRSLFAEPVASLWDAGHAMVGPTLASSLHWRAPTRARNAHRAFKGHRGGGLRHAVLPTAASAPPACSSSAGPLAVRWYTASSLLVVRRQAPAPAAAAGMLQALATPACASGSRAPLAAPGRGEVIEGSALQYAWACNAREAQGNRSSSTRLGPHRDPRRTSGCREGRERRVCATERGGGDGDMEGERVLRGLRARRLVSSRRAGPPSRYRAEALGSPPQDRLVEADPPPGSSSPATRTRPCSRHGPKAGAPFERPCTPGALLMIVASGPGRHGHAGRRAGSGP